MNENESISIKDLIDLMLSHLLLIIILTVLGGAAGFGVSKLFMPEKFSSHITMYVQSYTGISENTNNLNNISNSKQLVNTYMEVLKDDAVMQAVGEKLAQQFDLGLLGQNFTVENGTIQPASLRQSLSISSVTDTSAVKVTATTKNPEISAAICNDLTLVAPQYVEEAVGVGSINTIDTAKVYIKPVAPNVKKNTVIGMAAAFALTVMIIFLIDFFDNTIKDTDILSRTYQKPIIGEIQQFGTEKKKKKKNQDEYDHLKLTDKNVPFYIVESYKSIRTNVTFSLSTVERKIFAVSSANPGEGKSTTSSNIAIALAQGGNKVLLIDADMRKGVQHKVFGLKNKKGLSSAISRMNQLEECIQKNVMENLDVMTAGPIPPNPSELLASEQMGVILDRLIQEYGIIIIDTPPVNVVTDAMELAKYVSGIIVVLRYGRTTSEDAEAAYKKIEFSQMNLFGFILNGIKTKHNGRYYSKYKYKDKYYYKKGYGYGYGYGYGHQNDTTESEDDDVDSSVPVEDVTQPTEAPAPEPITERAPEAVQEASAEAIVEEKPAAEPTAEEKTEVQEAPVEPNTEETLESVAEPAAEEKIEVQEAEEAPIEEAAKNDVYYEIKF